MKKSIFILAALFAATFANAQINLLHTLNGIFAITMNTATTYGGQFDDMESPYFYEMSPANNDGYITVNLYDPEDFSLYKAVTIPAIGGYYNYISIVSRNILTQDNKVCFCLYDPDPTQANTHTYVYNEDAEQIAMLDGNNPMIASINGKYRLITYGGRTKNETYIYSLPGNGIATEISSPSPKRSARKIAREGQVLVETENNTFDLRGQEVK